MLSDLDRPGRQADLGEEAGDRFVHRWTTASSTWVIYELICNWILHLSLFYLGVLLIYMSPTFAIVEQ